MLGLAWESTSPGSFLAVWLARRQWGGLWESIPESGHRDLSAALLIRGLLRRCSYRCGGCATLSSVAAPETV